MLHQVETQAFVMFPPKTRLGFAMLVAGNNLDQSLETLKASGHVIAEIHQHILHSPYQRIGTEANG